MGVNADGRKKEILTKTPPHAICLFVSVVLASYLIH